MKVTFFADAITKTIIDCLYRAVAKLVARWFTPCYPWLSHYFLSPCISAGLGSNFLPQQFVINHSIRVVNLVIAVCDRALVLLSCQGGFDLTCIKSSNSFAWCLDEDREIKISALPDGTYRLGQTLPLYLPSVAVHSWLTLIPFSLSSCLVSGL